MGGWKSLVICSDHDCHEAIPHLWHNQIDFNSVVQIYRWLISNCMCRMCALAMYNLLCQVQGHEKRTTLHSNCLGSCCRDVLPTDGIAYAGSRNFHFFPKWESWMVTLTWFGAFSREKSSRNNDNFVLFSFSFFIDLRNFTHSRNTRKKLHFAHFWLSV